MMATTGLRSLMEAYDEAKRKNGWEKDGLTEKAVFALAKGKMMDVWPRMQRADFRPGAILKLGEFYGWLYFGDGVKLLLALARSCVVYMTDKIGPIGRYDSIKMRLLDEHMTKLAFWAVSECARGRYEWKVTEKCIDTLAIGAGCCTDDDWMKSVERSAAAMEIPLPVDAKEAAQIVAALEKIGGAE